MAEDAETKARRRRRIRESFTPPLNGIALRHVDTVQALDDSQREILAKVLERKGVHCLAECLALLKTPDVSFENEAALIERLEQDVDTPSRSRAVLSEQRDSAEDENYLAALLMRCYPDMPQSSADALVISNVMASLLRVVVSTRKALEDAKSDFVITTLYALFEDKLHSLKQIINSNPSFIKAIQHSHPDWNTKK